MSASFAETVVLVRAVARKSLVLRARYAFDTVTTLLVVYAFFALAVFGGRELAPRVVDEHLGGIVVGFFLLLMASVAYADLSWELVREAEWGTLEQLYVSPHGFGRVVAVETAVTLLVSFAYGVALLALMLATTRTRLLLDPLTVVPLGALALCSAVGVGFALGGLALVFERVESALRLAQFALVALVALPVDAYPVLKLLPLALGSDLLRESMAAGRHLWGLPPADLGLLVVTAVVYAGGGYAVFRLGIRRARTTGRLGRH
ncbi:ABC transporter permease [Halomarina pelagica]|uniref:ABC transporter permease n=1 Tax=Halomarina pelagica TaxID=2961599 RepID=UPI0020C53021|nr:ABC transporter permease [Halomarina sp. BND7]